MNHHDRTQLDLRITARVAWHEGDGFRRPEVRGVVERMTGATVWVKRDGASADDPKAIKTWRRQPDGSVRGLYVLGDYDLAMEAWEARRPRTKHLQIDRGFMSKELALDLNRSAKPTPETLEQICQEAATIGTWLKSKPEVP